MRIFLSGLGVVGQAVCELLANSRKRGVAGSGGGGAGGSDADAALPGWARANLQLAGVMDSRLVALAGTMRAELDCATVLMAKRGGGLQALVGAAEAANAIVTPAPAPAPDMEDERAAAALVAAMVGSGVQVYVDCSPTNIRAANRPTQIMLAAMCSGIHVVSANKGPLATAMPQLTECARTHRALLRYSGTVGGGTPMLALGSTLAMGDRVVSCRGILNGTTNFILSRMADDSVSFANALAEAQRLGYAEADPSADVDGWDAAAKVVITAASVLGLQRTIADVSVTGISGVTAELMASAAARSKVIKLIASASASELSVRPTEIDAASPMNTPGGTNVLEYTLGSGTTVMLIGRGAGGTETASSVLRDLAEIAHIHGQLRGH